jgi:hypothetical protein
MSFSTYIHNIHTQIGLVGLFITCVFAWWKGGPAEKLGAGMLCFSWLGADLARGLSGQMIPEGPMFVSDVLISLGFLYVAIRYSSLWLGAAMIFRSIAFVLHSAYMSDHDAPRWHGMIVYLLITNILGYLVFVSLCGGTIATILKRRRVAREKAEAEAKAARRAQRLTGAQPPLAGAA